MSRRSLHWERSILQPKMLSQPNENQRVIKSRADAQLLMPRLAKDSEGTVCSRPMSERKAQLFTQAISRCIPQR